MASLQLGEEVCEGALQKNSVARVVALMLDYCTCAGWSISDVLVEQERTFQSLQDNVVDCSPVWDFLPKVAEAAFSPSCTMDSLTPMEVAQVLLNMAIYCRDRGWSLQEIMNESLEAGGVENGA
jgi:hypothetical protein